MVHRWLLGSVGPSHVSPTALRSWGHDSKAPGCHVRPTTWKLSMALAIARAFGGQLGVLQRKPSCLDPNGLPNPLSLRPVASCCPLAFLPRPSWCSWQDPVSFCGATSGDGDPPPCTVASGVGLQSSLCFPQPPRARAGAVLGAEAASPALGEQSKPAGALLVSPTLIKA